MASGIFSEMEGLQRAENPTQETQRFFGETLMGRGWRYAAFGRSGAFGASGTSAPHAMFSSCALAVTRVCSLAAVRRPSAAAATGSAAFGASLLAQLTF